MNELCNCGQPIRYTHRGDQQSCNKYVVCPTYDDLMKERDAVRSANGMYLKALLQIRDTNACDYEYRFWAKKALSDVERLPE